MILVYYFAQSLMAISYFFLAYIYIYIDIPSHSELKFRPILAGLSYPTNRRSKLIDVYLQPFLIKLHTRKNWSQHTHNHIWR